MNTPFEKHILDINTMMGKFLVEDPAELLDMFELAVDYLPKELKKLNQAIEDNNFKAIRDCVHSLKGGIAYMSAPECNELIVKWEEKLRLKKHSKIELSDMLKHIESALAKLCDALVQIIALIKNRGRV